MTLDQINALLEEYDRPDDCTCDGVHTSAVGREVPDMVLRHIIIDRSVCPAERRAIDRILTAREVNL